MDKSIATTKSWGDQPERRSLRDMVAFGAVAALHLGFVLLLLRDRLPAEHQVRPMVALTLLREARRPPPVPAVRPALQVPAVSVPVPDIEVTEVTPKARASPRAQHPAQVRAPAADGLDMDVTASQGGGGSARAALGDFEAGVKARILARKRQPVLAKDLRNTCLINYTISIDRAGHMVAFHIDPCTVAAINAAARDAIGGAGPFAPPPDLGAAHMEVHGSLVFEP